MTVEIEFAEQQPFPSTSDLTIFNGGVKRGVTTLYAFAILEKPVSAGVVSLVTIRKIHKGRFGAEATVSFPTIAGGAGSVTSFSATLNRRFSYKGKKVSALTLECPDDGKIQTRSKAIFSDGTTTQNQVLRSCTAKGRPEIKE